MKVLTFVVFYFKYCCYIHLLSPAAPRITMSCSISLFVEFSLVCVCVVSGVSGVIVFCLGDVIKVLIMSRVLNERFGGLVALVFQSMAKI